MKRIHQEACFLQSSNALEISIEPSESPKLRTSRCRVDSTCLRPFLLYPFKWFEMDENGENGDKSQKGKKGMKKY